MKVDLTAMLKTFEDFMKVYQREMKINYIMEKIFCFMH